MKRPKRTLLLISAAMAAALAGCSEKPMAANAKRDSKPPEPLVVPVDSVQSRRIERAILVTGSLHADETVTVSAEVPGRITAIHVDFGSHVRKGAVIAELDRREFALRLQRSRAALSQALARIGLDPGQAEGKPESTPAIRQARAQLEDARFKYESAAKLVESGDISRERFTELEKAYRARQAVVEGAGDELRTQLANIEALKAEVSLAEKQLGDTTLRAPFEGSVTEKMASPGQYMKENTPIVRLVKTRPLRLRLEIPESAAGAVRVGTTLGFTTDAAPGERFGAVVREVNAALDPNTRILTAEARLTADNPRLKPGMFVQVRLVVERDAEVVVVPNEAVYRVAGLTKLFTIREGRVVEHRIAAGEQLDGWVVVPGGSVEAGDQVAVGSLGQLVEGLAVKPSARS